MVIGIKASVNNASLQQVRHLLSLYLALQCGSSKKEGMGVAGSSMREVPTKRLLLRESAVCTVCTELRFTKVKSLGAGTAPCSSLVYVLTFCV